MSDENAGTTDDKKKHRPGVKMILALLATVAGALFFWRKRKSGSASDA